ncbi:hypothetical protein TRAPUB_3506 [Trametes pubescens]|uniref:F-box domain-containing protein n=1 Tax=Trametes pubescens TaxID=154538 RepID=A0A1M2VDK6_TRAPU|nr:hypothetical protein TRAPUB_4090 [Trametes pubescens]OJT05286.1 hypothetical protein TRAPUB_3950 [Trametes pubescens]OJT05664.1 hypothetical protein TRAPUB_3506 [Trametes pubescens]
MQSLTVSILRRIFAYSDLETLLLACRPASSTFATAVDEELKDRMKGLIGWSVLSYELTYLLSRHCRFAADVEEMRNAMRASHAFIGGSLPLRMFSPIKFIPSNADIFVPISGAAVLIQHLSTHEGYRVESANNISPIAMPNDPQHDTAVVTYGAGLQSITVMRQPGKTVNVHTFPNPHPFVFAADVITLSWTTLLFNFVTADYAICAYPELSLKGRGLFHMERFLRGMPGGSSNHILNEYADRGFDFAGHPSWWFARDYDACSKGSTCPLSRRTFGDGGCLIIPSREGPGDAFGRDWIFGGVTDSVHDM